MFHIVSDHKQRSGNEDRFGYTCFNLASFPGSPALEHEHLKSIAVQAEFIADRKIAPALRGGDASVLESPLAAHSKENVAANLAALADLIDHDHAGVYRLRDYLQRAHNEASVGDQLASVVAEAQGRVAAFTASFERIVTGQATGDIESIRVDFQKLSSLGEDAAVAAGLDLGFNSEDGD